MINLIANKLYLIESLQYYNLVNLENYNIDNRAIISLLTI